MLMIQNQLCHPEALTLPRLIYPLHTAGVWLRQFQTVLVSAEGPEAVGDGHSAAEVRRDPILGSELKLLTAAGRLREMVFRSPRTRGMVLGGTDSGCQDISPALIPMSSKDLGAGGT